MKTLLLAAVIMPMFLVQPPAAIPAKLALTTVYESVGTTDGPVDVIKKIIEAETALMIRLEDKYGFKQIPAKYGGGLDTVTNQVTF